MVSDTFEHFHKLSKRVDVQAIQGSHYSDLKLDRCPTQ